MVASRVALLGLLLFLLSLPGLYGAVGVLGSPATGIALKVALASLYALSAPVAGALVLIAHGGLLGGWGRERLPVGGLVVFMEATIPRSPVRARVVFVLAEIVASAVECSFGLAPLDPSTCGYSIAFPQNDFGAVAGRRIDRLPAAHARYPPGIVVTTFRGASCMRPLAQSWTLGRGLDGLRFMATSSF
ncbi:hypothetical protein TO66_19850 [Pseudomonas sp. MRSN 12121]|nr:hypothetical protein TO66_19850 [Pseudomonas sp. MRSN 12121]